MRKQLPDLIIWGGTGNFKVLCELLQNDYHIAGYFDNNPAIQPEYRGIPHLGNREAFLQWVQNLGPEKPAFIVSIGPGYGAVRQQIHREIASFGLQPVTAVHRTAFVAETATIGLWKSGVGCGGNTGWGSVRCSRED